MTDLSRIQVNGSRIGVDLSRPYEMTAISVIKKGMK